MVGHRLAPPADADPQLSHEPVPLGMESSKLALLLLLTPGEMAGASRLFHDTHGIDALRHRLVCEEEHGMRKSYGKVMTLDQEITALADGTLRGRRRSKAEARLAERPELLGSVERQCRAVRLLRELAPDLPPKLRTRIEEERRRAGNFPRHRFP
jgi:hypothetical protein